MEIPAIAGGRLISDLVGRGAAASEPVPPTSPQETDAIAPAARMALARIVERYDVTDISPRELSELVERLAETGGLPPEDTQLLASLRLELDRAGVDADESVDLLDYLDRKLHALGGGDREESTIARRQLGWLRKFAAIAAGEGEGGVDVRA